MRTRRPYLNVGSRGGRASTFAALLVLAVAGCDFEGQLAEREERNSCQARIRVGSVLANPEQVSFLQSETTREIPVKPGWCKADQIELRVKEEAPTKGNFLFEVKCGGHGRFNLQYTHPNAEVEAFTIYPFSEKIPSEPQRKCN